MLAGITESISTIVSKFEAVNASAKDTVNAIIRNAVQEKSIEVKSNNENEASSATMKSIFDLTSEFPNLKKDDILMRFSDEIAINYRYLGIVAVDLLKDTLKIAKAPK